MSRANIPESERQDFTLYVDEFQNFATDSFESILSEARKYRLSLVVANQFMGQLTDKIRGAVHGNVGTYIIGRCGTDDVDDVVKLLQPVFQSSELINIPNFTAAVKMLIHGKPTRPFSMELPKPMGDPNPQLAAAIAQISAEKYGGPRAKVEAEINARLSTGRPTPTLKPAQPVITAKPSHDTSLVDNWIKRRQSAPVQTIATPTMRPASVVIPRSATSPATKPKPAQPRTSLSRDDNNGFTMSFH